MGTTLTHFVLTYLRQYTHANNNDLLIELGIAMLTIHSKSSDAPLSCPASLLMTVDDALMNATPSYTYLYEHPSIIASLALRSSLVGGKTLFAQLLLIEIAIGTSSGPVPLWDRPNFVAHGHVYRGVINAR